MTTNIRTDFWDYLDELVSSHPMVIDRPKGTPHPSYPEVIYPLDYGYLKETTSIDGGGIDIWLGTEGVPISNDASTKKISALILTVDLHKNDTEVKILLNCSETEIQTVLAFHNDNRMRALLVRKPTSKEK